MKRSPLLATIFIVVVFLGIYSFKHNDKGKRQLFLVEGTTMGVVSYHIKYIASEQSISEKEIQPILDSLNQIFSTYVPESQISKYNQLGQLDTLYNVNPLFIQLLNESKEIYEKTDGYFDPTVMPIVNALGFGPAKANDTLTQTQIDSMKNSISFEGVQWNESSIWKARPQVSIDLSAIAKGFVIDQMAQFLILKKITDFMVEIGGEVRCSGLNLQVQPWAIGIEDTWKTETDSIPQIILHLRNTSLATSGNYRNFNMKNGKKYVHTVDPKTGTALDKGILSASVMAETCTQADGIATALMAMGTEYALEFLKHNTEIQALLIYRENGNAKIYYSPELENFYFQKDKIQ